jgi:hypothetical protein
MGKRRKFLDEGHRFSRAEKETADLSTALRSGRDDNSV